MKQILIVGIVVLISQLTSAQEVVFEEQVVDDTLEITRGPNRKNFTHVYLGYGFVTGPSEEGAKIKPFLSSDFISGIRYKRKIGEYYSLGFGIAYRSTSYNLAQTKSKNLPNDQLHQSEKLLFHNAEGEVYNRINFAKRGDVLGKYLDIGAFAYLTFASRHIFRDKLQHPSAIAREVKIVASGLKFTEPFQYGLVSRVGFGRFAFYGKYRLSEMFKSKYAYPELPKIIAGVELAIYY